MLCKAPYYVIGIGLSPEYDNWVLSTAKTIAQAENAVRWQYKNAPAETNPYRFAVATWDGQKFLIESGGAIDFPLRRSPYTKTAYAAFMEAHGINPIHMM
jgi:hypothetical protein